MLKFIKQLKESDFVDLMVSIGQMRYGDESRLYEYLDKTDRRIVHLWDNGDYFKDNGQNYIWVNDYETSNQNSQLKHNVFMLFSFGQEWYVSAKKYFEGKNRENLDILSKAKAEYDRELKDDEEFIQSLV